MEARGTCEPLAVTIGLRTRAGIMPCPVYIELNFLANSKLEYIIFQNHYTSSVSIK